MTTPSKRKGSGGEREAAKVLASLGLSEAVRTPLSGAYVDFPGDIRLSGFCVEVKRTETLRFWAMMAQAEAAARGGVVPIGICRRNRSGWYVTEGIETWAPRVAELRAAAVWA